MTKKLIAKIIKIANDLDWSVKHYPESNQFSFQRFSGEGQDFWLEDVDGEDLYELVHDLWERYNNFDVSEEAYMWLDSSGHGTNGAPYDMRDVYNDMEECQEEIEKLHDALEELRQTIGG